MSLLCRRLYQFRAPVIRSFCAQSFNWDTLIKNSNHPEAVQQLTRLKAQCTEIMSSAGEFSKPLEPIDFAYYRSRISNKAVVDRIEKIYKTLSSPEEDKELNEINAILESGNVPSEQQKDELIERIFKYFGVEEMAKKSVESKYDKETQQKLRVRFLEEVRIGLKRIIDRWAEDTKKPNLLNILLTHLEEKFKVIRQEIAANQTILENYSNHMNLFEKYRTTDKTQNYTIHSLYPGIHLENTYDQYIPNYPKSLNSNYDPHEDNVEPLDLSDIDSRLVTKVDAPSGYFFKLNEKNELLDADTNQKVLSDGAEAKK
jgi:hypothetical protein